MMASDTFLTLARECVFQQKIEGSKFIALATPVTTIAAAEEVLNALRKKYHDATHNCWAYRVRGEQGVIDRSSDDGEPSGSAGAPMLDVIKGREVTNIVAVVTRYYGGTKLGVGGLIRAYGGTLAEALDSGEIKEVIIKSELMIVIDYSILNAVLRVLSAYNADVEQGFEGEKAAITVHVRRSETDRLKADLIDSTGGKVEFR